MKTYETIDVSVLSLVKKGRENIYLCPFCVEKVGKKDTEGKLYWNETKGCGWCFRCETVIFLPEEEKEGGKAAPYADGFLQTIDVFIEKREREKPQPLYFDFPPCDEEALLYLQKRNPFLPRLTKWLNLRSWVGKDRGVITPFHTQHGIEKFQVRFIDREKGKYYNQPPGSKIPYSPLHTFRYGFPSIEEVTLCEGTFDAIALFLLGYMCPLAILGKTLTPIQIEWIRALTPERVVVCCDTQEINTGIRDMILREKIFPSVEHVSTHDMWEDHGGDPEKYFVQLLQNREIRERANDLCKFLEEAA